MALIFTHTFIYHFGVDAISVSLFSKANSATELLAETTTFSRVTKVKAQPKLLMGKNEWHSNLYLFSVLMQ